MSEPPKRIFTVGLKPRPGTEAAYGAGFTGEEVQAKIQAGAKRLAEAGYSIERKLIVPEEFDASLSTIKDKLGAEKWDGFVIGNGIRSTAALTVQFEFLVNASREVAPKTKLIFNVRPEDLYEAVTRNFE